MVSLIDKALEIAEEYPVFACGANKAPIVAGGFKAATQDPAEIVKMFSKPNAALIGVPTGEASGLFVIDIDVRDGKGGAEWLKKNAHILGITRMVQTMSGGWHLYFEHEEGLRNFAGIDGCVDGRGEGGYVCFPDGEKYRFINDEEIAPLPSEMRLRLSYYDGNIPTNLVQHVAEDGLGRIVDGREKAMAAMIMASVGEYVRQHGVPPTVEYLVQNVWPRYKARVVSRTGDLEQEGRGLNEFVKKAQSTIGRARRGLIKGIEQAPEKPTATQAQPESIAQPEIRRREITLRFMEELELAPPPKFLIGDYILENSLACVFAPPASYKSFIVLDWALSIAHGVDWHGRPTRRAPVVYCAMEGQTGLINRALAWHHDKQLSSRGVKFGAVTSSMMMADNGQQDTAALIEAIDGAMDEPPALVVIDTLARVMDGDENTQTSMSAFVRHCDQIREHFGCTVLIVHHTGKAGGSARGSSVLQGAVDTELELKREAGGQNVVKMIVTKQKDIEEVEPMYLQAREVSFVSHGLAPERTSLVLDIIEQPDGSESRKPISKLQRTAMDILQRMLSDPNMVEYDDDGSSGVPRDVWQHAVDAEMGEERGDGYHRKWNGRRSDWKWLTEFNGLVNFAL